MIIIKYTVYFLSLKHGSIFTKATYLLILFCQQLNLKNILSKQEEQRQNHGYGEHFDGCQMGGGCGGMGEEGVKKHK